MPKYVHECALCGELEAHQSILESSLTRCPARGGAARRWIAGGAGFSIKAAASTGPRCDRDTPC